MSEILIPLIGVVLVIALITFKIINVMHSIKYKKLLKNQAGIAQKITPEINEAYYLYWKNRLGERKVKYLFNEGQLQIERDGVIYYLEKDIAKCVKEISFNESDDAAIYMIKTKMKFDFNSSETIVRMILRS